MILLYKIHNDQTFPHYIHIQLLPPPGDTNLNYSSITQDQTVDLIIF